MIRNNVETLFDGMCVYIYTSLARSTKPTERIDANTLRREQSMEEMSFELRVKLRCGWKGSR